MQSYCISYSVPVRKVALCSLSPSLPEPVTSFTSCRNPSRLWIDRRRHALGFYHEHTRPDRDDYITIRRENVRKGESHAEMGKVKWSLIYFTFTTAKDQIS